ncbi:MAG TPA: hypothetical protein VEL49_10840 [Ktedonobacteraceae bacterium]|nr:hypothetical protein [Ktedonobacteraceae bacterium]
MNSPFAGSSFSNEGQVLMGQPPIVGDEGGSVFLTRDGYIYGHTMGDFGSRIEEGLCFLLDIQSDSFDEQILLGSGVTDGTAFRIRLHVNGIPNRVEMMLRDDDGKALAGYVDTSVSRAKRLVCTADPRSNLLAFFELQPWVDNELQIHYTKQDRPIRFSDLVQPLIMGGWNLDGQRKGYYVGRLANVAIFNRWYTKQATKGLKKASTNPTNLPLIGQVSLPNSEQLIKLDSDIKKLQRFSQKPLMEYDDFFDASIILYRWFLDTHPMIRDVCEAYGIQLWFYGKSDAERKYSSVVLDNAPIYFQKSSFGSDSLFGFKWTTLEAFWQEESFFVDRKPISHRHFIDLVRNKLGGGHFDKDRSPDQRKLLELTTQLQLANQKALYYQMHQLTRGVMEAIKTCGVLEAIQLDLSGGIHHTI